MLRDVESMTGDAISPAVGSLYRVIDALARDGLIELDHEDVVDGRMRRHFRLTSSGRTQLLTTSDTMRRVTQGAEERLAVADPKPAAPIGLA